ncbi:MAG: hypothetical protein V3T86_12215 [Planctomycetota bacterium]
MFHRIATYAACAALLLLAACQSAEDYYKDGQEKEASGRHAEAARHYIEALQDDANFPGARERLKTSGSKALAELRGIAWDLEAAGRHAKASDQLVTHDGLFERALAVGVRLDTGAGYEARRRKIRDAAFDAMVAEGHAARERGEYERALATYDRAESRFSPQSDRAAALTGPRYQTTLGWARAEFDAGRHRHAHELAQQAIAHYGPEATESAAARALRDRAVELGTVTVVVLPPWRADAVAKRIPDGFLAALDATLAEEHWVGPPLFLSYAPSADVRRELRRLEFDRQILSEARASAVGESVDARLVVIPVIRKWNVFSEGSEAPRAATTRKGEPTQYRVFKGQRVLEVRGTLRVVEVATKNRVRESRFSATVKRDARYGIHNEPNSLALGKKEARLFDLGRLDAIDEELGRSMRRELATRLAAAVTDALNFE